MTIPGSSVSISLPALMLYIPFFRQFVADTLVRCGFPERFAYRTEIIVDELCTNAISYGNRSNNARIEVKLSWYEDYIDLFITDEGERPANITALQEAVATPVHDASELSQSSNTLGLEIVKMLSDKIDVSVDDENITTVHIIQNRKVS